MSYKPFFDLREKAEIIVCAVILAIGVPVCIAIGTASAQKDFKTLNPDEKPAAIKALEAH